MCYWHGSTSLRLTFLYDWLFLMYSFRPLHIAAKNGLKKVVHDLLSKGANVLAVDENGKYIYLLTNYAALD